MASFNPVPKSSQIHPSKQAKRRKKKKKGDWPSKPSEKESVETRLCLIHNEPMFPRDGGTRFSHQLPDGTWCNGAAPKAPKKQELLKRELPSAMQVTRL